MRSPFGYVLALVFSLALAGPRPAAAQLTEERTRDLRLVYLDGSESYLVPHVTRTALNSLAFQKKLFGFDPQQELTVVLLDSGDGHVPHVIMTDLTTAHQDVVDLRSTTGLHAAFGLVDINDIVYVVGAARTDESIVPALVQISPSP